MKAVARVVGFVLGALALVAGALVLSLTMWLRTASGRHWLEREASQRLALAVTVGRIKGGILGGVRLEDVAVRDPRGSLVARADVLSVRYRLLRLARLHEVDEIAIVRPVVMRVPSTAARPAAPPGKPMTFSVRNATITDGTFHWHGHDLEHLWASTAIRLQLPAAQVQHFAGEVSAMLDEQPLFVRFDAAADRGRVRLWADLHGAAFAARARGDWVDGRLDGTLESLDVEPTLLTAARPWSGRGALHARGAAVGPLDALDLTLRGHTANRGFALHAEVDAPRGRAGLSASVATPTRRAGLHARAALHGDAVDVTALAAHTGATRLRGVARLDARRVEATLDARLAPAEAAVVGIQTAGPIQVRAALHGPPRALDVAVYGRLYAAQVTLGGRVDLPARRGQLRFVTRDVLVSQIDRRAPDLAFSGAFTFDGALREGTGLAGTLSVTDGSLRVAGRSFDRLNGSARVALAARGEARVEALSGQMEGERPRPIEVQTQLRWDRQALHVDVNRIAVGGSRATGDIVYAIDPVTRQAFTNVRARKLSLSPRLVEEALHRRPAKAFSGSAALRWTPSSSALTFALDTEQGPARGAVALRRDRGALELPRIDVSLGDSHVRGAARVQNGEVVASLDELLLQPSLVHWLSPTLEPDRAVRIAGAAAGPLHALDVRLVATAGGSTARLRGLLDLPGRRFELFATTDTFYLQSVKETRTSRVNLELSLVGRLVAGGVAGKLTVRHASGVVEAMPLDAARIDVTLDGPRFNVDQVLIGVPGAVFEGSGGGTYRDFHVGYGVVITDALALRKVPKPLRLMVGVTALSPGRSVVGKIQRHQGGKIEVTHRAIPPPFRVVNLLYHLMLGHPLHLTVK
jgi:hypothetical protein